MSTITIADLSPKCGHTNIFTVSKEEYLIKHRSTDCRQYAKHMSTHTHANDMHAHAKQHIVCKYITHTIPYLNQYITVHIPIPLSTHRVTQHKLSRRKCPLGCLTNLVGIQDSWFSFLWGVM